MPRTCSKGSPPLNNRHSFALTTSIFQKMMRIVLIVLLMRNINYWANLLLTPRRTLVTGNISRVSWEAHRCEENKEVKAPGHSFFWGREAGKIWWWILQRSFSIQSKDSRNVCLLSQCWLWMPIFTDCTSGFKEKKSLLHQRHLYPRAGWEDLSLQMGHVQDILLAAALCRLKLQQSSNVKNCNEKCLHDAKQSSDMNPPSRRHYSSLSVRHRWTSILLINVSNVKRVDPVKSVGNVNKMLSIILHIMHLANLLHIKCLVFF